MAEEPRFRGRLERPSSTEAVARGLRERVQLTTLVDRGVRFLRRREPEDGLYDRTPDLRDGGELRRARDDLVDERVRLLIRQIDEEQVYFATVSLESVIAGNAAWSR